MKKIRLRFIAGGLVFTIMGVLLLLGGVVPQAKAEYLCDGPYADCNSCPQAFSDACFDTSNGVNCCAAVTPTPTSPPQVLTSTPTPTPTPAPACNYSACGANGCAANERYITSINGGCTQSWFTENGCYPDDTCGNTTGTAPTNTPTPTPTPGPDTVAPNPAKGVVASYDAINNEIDFVWGWNGDNTCTGCVGPVGFCTSSGVSNTGFACDNVVNPPFWWQIVDESTNTVIYKAYNNQTGNTSFNWNASNATKYSVSCKNYQGKSLRIDVRTRDAFGNIVPFSGVSSDRATCPAPTPTPTNTPTPTPLPTPTPQLISITSLTVQVDSYSPSCTNDGTPTWNWTYSDPDNQLVRFEIDRNDVSGTVNATTTTNSYTPAVSMVGTQGNGQRAIKVRGVGSWSSSSWYPSNAWDPIVTIDQTPPAVPSSVSVTGTANGAVFSWSPSSDLGCGNVSGYAKYYWIQGWWSDGTWIINNGLWSPGSVTNPSYTISCNGKEGQTFTLNVRQAKDSLQNASTDLNDNGNTASYTCPSNAGVLPTPTPTSAVVLTPTNTPTPTPPPAPNYISVSCNVNGTTATLNWGPGGYDSFLQVGSNGSRNTDGSLVTANVFNSWVGPGSTMQSVTVVPGNYYYAVVLNTADSTYTNHSDYYPVPGSVAYRFSCSPPPTNTPTPATGGGVVTPTPTPIGGGGTVPSPTAGVGSPTPTLAVTPTPTSAATGVVDITINFFYDKNGNGIKDPEDMDQNVIKAVGEGDVDYLDLEDFEIADSRAAVNVEMKDENDNNYSYICDYIQQKMGRGCDVNEEDEYKKKKIQLTLPRQAYSMTLTAPNGYVFTTGSGISKDCQVNGAQTYTLVFGNGGDQVVKDIGFVKVGTLITGFWVDKNKNGIKDANEKGLEEVTNNVGVSVTYTGVGGCQGQKLFTLQDKAAGVVDTITISNIPELYHPDINNALNGNDFVFSVVGKNYIPVTYQVEDRQRSVLTPCSENECQAFRSSRKVKVKLGSPDTVLVGVTPDADPWIQVKNGDVSVGGVLNIAVPADQVMMVNDVLSNLHGILTAGTITSPTDPVLISSTGSYYSDNYSPWTSAFDRLTQKLQWQELSSLTDLASLNSGIYKIVGNVDLGQPVTALPATTVDLSGTGKVIVIIIDGNLNINQNIITDANSSVAFIVSGNVNIDHYVENLDAVVVFGGSLATDANDPDADPTVDLPDTGADYQLTINGALIGLSNSSSFVLGRSLTRSDNATIPVTTIIYQPKDLYYLHQYLARPEVYQQEKTPSR